MSSTNISHSKLSLLVLLLATSPAVLANVVQAEERDYGSIQVRAPKGGGVRVSAPRPVVAAPKPVIAAPKPVIEPPKPVVAPPKPVVAPPKPVEAPKPVVAPPKPVVAPPKPAPVENKPPPPAANKPPAAENKPPPPKPEVKPPPPPPAGAKPPAPPPKGAAPPVPPKPAALQGGPVKPPAEAAKPPPADTKPPPPPAGTKPPPPEAVKPPPPAEASPPPPPEVANPAAPPKTSTSQRINNALDTINGVTNTGLNIANAVGALGSLLPQGAPPAGAPVDPNAQVDPTTGFPIDPATGLPIDPATGLPVDPAAAAAAPPPIAARSRSRRSLQRVQARSPLFGSSSKPAAPKPPKAPKVPGAKTEKFNRVLDNVNGVASTAANVGFAIPAIEQGVTAAKGLFSSAKSKIEGLLHPGAKPAPSAAAPAAPAPVADGSVDPATGLPIDPTTGLPVDPNAAAAAVAQPIAARAGGEFGLFLDAANLAVTEGPQLVAEGKEVIDHFKHKNTARRVEDCVARRGTSGARAFARCVESLNELD